MLGAAKGEGEDQKAVDNDGRYWLQVGVDEGHNRCLIASRSGATWRGRRGERAGRFGQGRGGRLGQRQSDFASSKNV
ncbi:hypothetical protein GW17_00031726 [Ensete ventricosum]|nr:hypothetical protein GW17_00031726 [Ensete ventricosum]